jgi:hypothetical protein
MSVGQREPRGYRRPHLIFLFGCSIIMRIHSIETAVRIYWEVSRALNRPVGELTVQEALQRLATAEELLLQICHPVPFGLLKRISRLRSYIVHGERYATSKV